MLKIQPTRNTCVGYFTNFLIIIFYLDKENDL